MTYLAILKILKNLVYISCFTLCFLWFDWKLIIILILFGWGMNIENYLEDR